MERLKSGIPGLDNLIEGGFIPNSTILLAGQTGAGKTIFGCQFLLEGAKNGEKGLYVTLEQSAEDIINDMSRFNWHKIFVDYVNKKIINFHYSLPTSIKELSSSINNIVEKLSIKRMVLDNLSVAMMGWVESAKELGKVRVEVFNMIKSLKSKNVTTILISEVPEEATRAISRFGFEEFVADAVIVLNYLEFGTGTSVRSLLIRKMRRTKHATEIFPLEITEEGLKVVGKIL